MTAYETLLAEAELHEVDIYEKPMKQTIKGLYGNNVIWINKYISTNVEKTCILAEELGHHFTTVGDITDQSKLENRKQEKQARTWAYEKLVSLEKIVQAIEAGCRNRFEASEYLDVTEEFFEAAINHYKEKYGLSYSAKNYTIFFEPLGVLKIFDEVL
jgi:hypothetical protein